MHVAHIRGVTNIPTSHALVNVSGSIECITHLRDQTKTSSLNSRNIKTPSHGENIRKVFPLYAALIDQHLAIFQHH